VVTRIIMSGDTIGGLSRQMAHISLKSSPLLISINFAIDTSMTRI